MYGWGRGRGTPRSRGGQTDTHKENQLEDCPCSRGSPTLLPSPGKASASVPELVFEEQRGEVETPHLFLELGVPELPKQLPATQTSGKGTPYLASPHKRGNAHRFGWGVWGMGMGLPPPVPGQPSRVGQRGLQWVPGLGKGHLARATRSGQGEAPIC